MPDTVPSATRRFLEGLAIAALAVMCVVGPLAIGGAPPWARLGLDGLAAVATIAWAVSARRSPWRLGVALVALAVGMLQLLPLPDGPLLGVAQVSGGRWKVALEGIPGAWGRIAVDPHATAMGLRQLFFAVAVAAVAADLGRVPRYRRWLVGSLAAAAVVILAAGVGFPLRKGEGKSLLGWYRLDGPLEFWRSPTAEPVASAAVAHPTWGVAGDTRYEIDEWISGDGFGSYVDTNKFAGGVYLTLPVACGVWLCLSRRWLPGLAGAAVRFGVATAVMAAGGWVTGKMAGSRAGTAALAFALLVLLAAAFETRVVRRLGGAVVAVAAALLLMAMLVIHGPLRGLERGLPDRFEPAVAKLLADGRAEASRVANRMFRAAPLLGTGLGSYRGMFPRLLADSPVHFAFAHDDVDQWLAETGLVGLAGGLGLVSLAGLAWYRWRKTVPAAEWACDAGVFAALAGLAVHSFFDWNLHLPANAFLASVLAGLALSVAPRAEPSPARGTAGTGLVSLVLTGLLCLSAVVSLALVVRDVRSAAVELQLREALVAVRRAALAKPPGELPEETLRRALAAGEAAGRFDGGNPDLPLLRGQVLLHLAAGAAGEEAAALSARAGEEFREARRRSAVCQGLPEPLASDPRRPGR